MRRKLFPNSESLREAIKTWSNNARLLNAEKEVVAFVIKKYCRVQTSDEVRFKHYAGKPIHPLSGIFCFFFFANTSKADMPLFVSFSNVGLSETVC